MSSTRTTRILAAFAGAAAAAVAAILVRPWEVGSVGFDSAASVLYYDRIMSRTTLEAFLGATPKPLLTFLYGPAYGITGDWRSIGFLTVIAFGVAVGLAGSMVARLSGPAAGAFVAVAILGSPLMLQDVTLSYATPLALLLLMVAGLALMGRRIYPLIAGVALMMAALARLETIVLAAAAAVVVAGSWLADRHRPNPNVRWRTYAPLLIAWLAIPIMVLHDLALTGDAGYWLQVSARYSQDHPDTVRSVGELLAFIGQRYRLELPLLALAGVGIWWCVSRGSTAIAIGLLVTTLGILGLLLALAARGTYVSTRYFLLVDLAIYVAAAIGLGATMLVIGSRLHGHRDPMVRVALDVAGVLAAIAIAFVLTRPWAPLAPAQRQAIDAQIQASANTDAAAAALVDPMPTGGCGPIHGDLVVPGLMIPRLAVDLSRSLTQIHPVAFDPTGAPVPPLHAGDAVVHERFLDRALDVPPALESGVSTDLPGGRLSPLLADPVSGIWVYEFCAPSSGARFAAPRRRFAKLMAIIGIAFEPDIHEGGSG